MTSTKVLVLTKEFDPHVAPVAEQVRHRGFSVIRFDLADFPEQIQLAAHIGSESGGWRGPLHLHSHGESYDLDEIGAIWYRRPTLYHAPQEYAPPVREFLERESLRGFVGILHGPFWVSDRGAIQAAEFKPAQLQVAQELGLSIPPTLITNDPAAVIAFFEACHGAMISKTVARGVIDPEQLVLKDQPRFIYTTRVQREDLEDLDGVRVCAHLFQALLPKVMDVRVVVIGKRVFAVGIHAHSEQAALDWRQDYSSVSYSIEQLPACVEDKLLQLVRSFGLQFSSADFVVLPDGEWVFIELNPNGQFYFLVPSTGLPMAEAMADLLCSPEEYRL